MTYSLIDRLADIGTPTAEEAIAEIAAKDALIRDMVGTIAARRETYIAAGAMPLDDAVIAEMEATALTRAKEMGYE